MRHFWGAVSFLFFIWLKYTWVYLLSKGSLSYTYYTHTKKKEKEKEVFLFLRKEREDNVSSQKLNGAIFTNFNNQISFKMLILLVALHILDRSRQTALTQQFEYSTKQNARVKTATRTNNSTQVKSCGLKWVHEKLRESVGKSMVHGQVPGSLFNQSCVFGCGRLIEWPIRIYADRDESIFRIGTQCP